MWKRRPRPLWLQLLIAASLVAVGGWCLLNLANILAHGRSEAVNEVTLAAGATSLAWFPFQHDKYRVYSQEQPDTSARCVSSGICDGVHQPGPDGLGLILRAVDRQRKVREATQWAWHGYKRAAWGSDELDPHSQSGRDWFGVGLTIVDSLDTLMIQGLWEEVAQARAWIAGHLEFEGKTVKVFECIIRVLGGLLSAFYHSGGDEVYLTKALDVADRLLPSFHTASGVHLGDFTLADPLPHGQPPGPLLSVGESNLGEAGTHSLELTTLSHITGLPAYRNVSMRFWHAAQSKMYSLDGLLCTDLDGDTLRCRRHMFTMGPAADSTYEYMLKQWILSAGQDEVCLGLYRAAMHGLRKHMVVNVHEEAEEGGSQHEEGQLMLATVIAQLRRNQLQVEARDVHLEHLACFVPGMLALGHMYGLRTTGSDTSTGLEPKGLAASLGRRHALTSRGKWHMPVEQQRKGAAKLGRQGQESDDLLLAAQLMRGCYDLYTRSHSGVAFDAVRFDVVSGQRGRQQALEVDPRASQDAQHGQRPDQATLPPPADHLDEQVFRFDPSSPDNHLRPEVAESLFYLYRATGDVVYQDWGWSIFRAYERWCRVREGGYTPLAYVNAVPPTVDYKAKMESFWVAETLKYLYLLFSEPDVIPLDVYVFNTEAHPLPIWGSEPDRRATQRLSPALRARLQRSRALYDDQLRQQQQK